MAAISLARAGWITPKQQLERLVEEPIAAIAAKVAGTLSNPGVLPVDAVAKIVAGYAISPNLTKWYRVLEELSTVDPSIFPDAIPPLPFEVRDNELLYLRPPRSANEIAAIVNAYGEAHFGAKHPLKFSFFCGIARQEHGDVCPREWQWISHTKDVLKGSRGWQPYSEHGALVVERLGANYAIPRLLDVIMVVFFDYIAGGTTLFSAGNEQYRHSYTLVQETIQGSRLTVGGFAPCGLSVSIISRFDDGLIGVAAVRK